MRRTLRVQFERRLRDSDHRTDLRDHMLIARCERERKRKYAVVLPFGQNSALTSGAIYNKCVRVMRKKARRNAAKARRMIGTARQKVSKWI